MLIDNHNRPLNYLRLAVTDRCNLRCFYCMPERGIQFLSKKDILSYEEMLRLSSILTELGVDKIRITGGEPFVRKDLSYFLTQLNELPKLKSINITTNGILTAQYLPLLKSIKLGSINLSLDTLSPETFYKITRRNEFDAVYETLQLLISENIKLKINMVVMDGINTQDIEEMAQLAKDHPIEMRIIEEMPFNGSGSRSDKLVWNAQKIKSKLLEFFPSLEPIPFEPGATAQQYTAPDFKGKIGIIAAFTRTFCGSCNRIRITAKGQLKTCLYDDGVLDLKTLLRSGTDDFELIQAFKSAFNNRAINGFEAEKNRTTGSVQESMTTIGG